MSGYDVSPTQLAAHATSFGGLVQNVHAASQAANTEGVLGGGNPYGVLFTPLILPILSTVCTATQGMIAAMAAAGDEITTSLNKNTDLYSLVEQQIGDIVTKAMPL